MGFGIQFQDIFHVSHYIGAHLGNAPLFLLPRLEDVFSGAGAPYHVLQGLNHAQLDHPACQQAKTPVVVAFGRGAAGQSDQVGFAPVVRLAVPVGLGPVLDRPVQPLFGETPLEQDARPGRNPDRTPPYRTVCSTWSRSSCVTQTANFSLTTLPPHNNIIHHS